MDTKDFIVNDSCKGKIIEDLGAVSPYVYGTILSQAFIIEPIDLRDLSALVVTSDQSDSLGVTYF